MEDSKILVLATLHALDQLDSGRSRRARMQKKSDTVFRNTRSFGTMEPWPITRASECSLDGVHDVSLKLCTPTMEIVHGAILAKTSIF